MSEGVRMYKLNIRLKLKRPHTTMEYVGTLEVKIKCFRLQHVFIFFSPIRKVYTVKRNQEKTIVESKTLRI